MSIFDPNATPICAVCNKPVDWIESRKDPRKRSIIISVGCHGETEEVEVGGNTLEDAVTIAFGSAFATPRAGSEKLLS